MKTEIENTAIERRLEKNFDMYTYMKGFIKRHEMSYFNKQNG